MKFSELIFNLNINDTYERELFFDLLFSISLKVKTALDFLTYRNEKIDFDFNVLLKKYNRYKDDQIPIEYIFNKINFCNKDFYIEKGVFIPRKETEYAIWDFINKHKDKKFDTILDLCSGSGIISCILKMWFPESNVIGIEKSKKSIYVSEKNMKLHNLDINFINNDIFLELKNICTNVNFVFFNPPYIHKEYRLDKSLSYEPKAALFAKENGIFYYKKFFNDFFHLFNKDTFFLIEFGLNQKQYLHDILKKNNIIKFEFIKDIFGEYRFLIINF